MVSLCYFLGSICDLASDPWEVVIWFLSIPVYILLFPLDKKKNKDEENWCVKLPESASLIGMGDKGKWEDPESRYIAVIVRWVRPEICTFCLSFRWVLWFFKPSFYNLKVFVVVFGFCAILWLTLMFCWSSYTWSYLKKQNKYNSSRSCWLGGRTFMGKADFIAKFPFHM